MTRSPILTRTHACRSAGQPLRLVAFGSSTTEGSGASGPDQTYPAVMREALLPAFPGGIVLTNLGIGGESAIEMDLRLADVIAAEPTLILWQTGSNDVTRPVPLPLFERLTRQGVARLRQTGADLVLVDQQYSRAMDEAPGFADYLAALHRIGDEAGLPVFPRHEAMRRWCAEGLFTRDSLSPDGTHMTDPGYRMLGQTLAAWLIERA